MCGHGRFAQALVGRFHNTFAYPYMLCYSVSAMSPREKVFGLALFFRALADRTRLRLLNLIGDRDLCVCYLVEVLQISQPKISRHLAYMRRSGLVAARREGKWMHYRVLIPADPAAARLLRETRQWLAQDRQMQRDRARLEKACCAPQKFVRLQGAPLPEQPAHLQ